MRFRFPRYKAFLVLAAYLAVFVVLSLVDAISVAIGAVVGAGFGGLILAVRTRKGLPLAAAAVVGSIVGSFLAIPLTSIGRQPVTSAYGKPDDAGFLHDNPDLAADCAVLSAAAILGGLLFLWAKARLQIPPHKMLLALPALYAAALALSFLVGPYFAVSAAIGAAVGLLLAARLEKDPLYAAITVAGSIIGAGLAVPLLFALARTLDYHGYEDAALSGAFAAIAIAATLGGLLFSWASKK